MDWKMLRGLVEQRYARHCDWYNKVYSNDQQSIYMLGGERRGGFWDNLNTQRFAKAAGWAGFCGYEDMYEKHMSHNEAKAFMLKTLDKIIAEDEVAAVAFLREETPNKIVVDDTKEKKMEPEIKDLQNRVADLERNYRKTVLGTLDTHASSILGLRTRVSAIEGLTANKLKSRAMLPVKAAWWVVRNSFNVARAVAMLTVAGAAIPWTRPYVFEYVGKAMAFLAVSSH